MYKRSRSGDKESKVRSQTTKGTGKNIDKYLYEFGIAILVKVKAIKFFLKKKEKRKPVRCEYVKC